MNTFNRYSQRRKSPPRRLSRPEELAAIAAAVAAGQVVKCAARASPEPSNVVRPTGWRYSFWRVGDDGTTQSAGGAMTPKRRQP